MRAITGDFEKRTCLNAEDMEENKITSCIGKAIMIGVCYLFAVTPALVFGVSHPDDLKRIGKDYAGFFEQGSFNLSAGKMGGLRKIRTGDFAFSEISAQEIRLLQFGLRKIRSGKVHPLQIGTGQVDLAQL